MDRYHLRDHEFIYEDISYPVSIIKAHIPGNQVHETLPEKGILFLDIIIERGADHDEIERDILRLLDRVPKERTRIARPLPLCMLKEEAKEKVLQFSPPRDCFGCVHLFKVDEKGTLTFCNAAKDAPPFSFGFFRDRKAIFEHFMTFTPDSPPSCRTCAHWLGSACSPCLLTQQPFQQDTRRER